MVSIFTGIVVLIVLVALVSKYVCMHIIICECAFMCMYMLVRVCVHTYVYVCVSGVYVHR